MVKLFLALAAVHFVISEHQPSSSYVLPTQQQVRFGGPLRDMQWQLHDATGWAAPP